MSKKEGEVLDLEDFTDPKIKKNSEYYKLVQAFHMKQKCLKEVEKAKQIKKGRLKESAKQKKKEFQEEIFHLQNIKRINITLKRAKKIMKKDLYAATALYETLHPLYRQLPDHLKQQVFSKIIPFYKKLEKSLEAVYEED